MFTWCLGFVNQHNGHVCKTLQRFHGLSHMWPLTPEYSNHSFECFFLSTSHVTCIHSPSFAWSSLASTGYHMPSVLLSLEQACLSWAWHTAFISLCSCWDCPTPVFKNYPEISGTSRVLSIILSVQGVRLHHHLAPLAHPKCKRFWERSSCGISDENEITPVRSQHCSSVYVSWTQWLI